MLVETLGFADEQAYQEDMAGKYKDGRLEWSIEGEWIMVDDLPVEFVAELMQFPFYAACNIIDAHLDDNNEFILLK